MGNKAIEIRGGDQVTGGQLVDSKSVAGATRVFHIHLANGALVTMYLQVYDAASEGTTSGTPLLIIPVPTLTSKSIYFPHGRRFLVGCTVVSSSTILTKTGGVSEAIIDIVHSVN